MVCAVAHEVARTPCLNGHPLLDGVCNKKVIAWKQEEAEALRDVVSLLIFPLLRHLPVETTKMNRNTSVAVSN